MVLDHVADLQIFMIDYIVGTYELERNLMVEVPSPPTYRLMRFGQECDGLAATATSLLATRDTPLGGFQRALRLAIPAGVKDACVVRQRSEGLDAQVDASLLASERKWLHWHVSARDADLPAVCFPRDRDGFGHARQRTRPADCKATNLGENQEAVVQSSAPMFSHLWIGKAGVAVAAMETRVARILPFAVTAKVRLKRAVDAQHHILQDLSIDVAVFRHRVPDVRQFRFLLIVGDTDATHPPGFPPLTYSGVIDMAAERKSMLKQRLLFSGGLEFVLEGFGYRLLLHASLFCLTGEELASMRTIEALPGARLSPPIAEACGSQPVFATG